MNHKIQSANRKFYNKWCYKLSLRLKNAGIFRKKDLDLILKESSSSDVLSVAAFLKDNPAQYGLRIERSTLDLYFNDQQLFNQGMQDLEALINNAFAIDQSDIDLIERSHLIKANKYPFDNYHYKVFLQPHKLSKDEKSNFLSWIDSQQEKIKITENVKSWFYRTEWNWDRRYMYVDNEKTLLMLKLRQPEAMGTIYTYVISDK
jgi:hypothetical protein